MNARTQAYFPEDLCALAPEARTALPFPLALTYLRLSQQVERQEPVAAAWMLKDALECALQYAAALACGDMLQATDPQDARRTELVSLLLKPNGLSIGDWHTLLTRALRSLAVHGNDPDVTGGRRLLADLYPAFFTPTGAPTDLNLDIDGRQRPTRQDPQQRAASFTRWRNEVFGHGPFRPDDRQWYADETIRWIETLHRFYAALQPLFAEWLLVGESPTERDDETLWQGADLSSPSPLHMHLPQGKPLAMLLRRRDGAVRLRLSPLLSVQRCGLCGQFTPFFYSRYDRKNKTHRTAFIEYLGGHWEEARDWEETRRLYASLPANFVWERTAAPKQEFEAGEQLELRDFSAEFLRPDYLLDHLREFINTRARGYLHIVGPAGSGKTYLARGLAEQEALPASVAAFAYHILPGTSREYPYHPTAEYQVFVTQLAQQVNARFETAGFQPASTDTEDRRLLRAKFAAFLADVRRQFQLEKLILAIDGLDELPDPDPHSAAITELLPLPEELPEGCYLLLTGRPRLQPRIREHLARLMQGPDESFVRIEIEPDGMANQELLRAYLRLHLPAPLRAEKPIETVLARSNGIFLYAHHFALALASGVFADATDLPSSERFYAAYLQRLRLSLGEQRYLRAYQPLLLALCAAQQPVTLEQLGRWTGVLPADLRYPLRDLRDFLRPVQQRQFHDGLTEGAGDTRYELAHVEFRNFVDGDGDLALHLGEMHARILHTAMERHTGAWNEIDPSDDADLYDLLHLIRHLHEAGRVQQHAVDVAGYMAACVNLGTEFCKKNRFRLAVDVLETALNLLLPLEDEPQPVVIDLVVTALVNQGSALLGLGRLQEAYQRQLATVALLRQLVKKGERALEWQLAKVLINQGNALRRQGRLAESISAYEEAEVYLRPLAAEREVVANDLALSLGMKGRALQESGREQEAVDCGAEAVTLLQRLALTGHLDQEADLAIAQMNYGNALDTAGRLQEALSAFDAAIGMHRRLLAAGTQEQENNLALSLSNRAGTLMSLGKLDQAAADYTEAAERLRRLVAAGRNELEPELASVLSHWSTALRRQGKQDRALMLQEEGIGLYQHLMQEAERSDLEPRLAHALMTQGNLLRVAGRLDESIAGFDQALTLLRALIAAGRRDLEPDLTSVLINQANSLQDAGKLPEAIHNVEEAIRCNQRMISEGRTALEGEQAAWRMNLGNMQRDAGRLSDARANHDEAVQRLRVLIASGRLDRESDLALALLNRGVTLSAQHIATEALADYREAAALYRRLIAAGQSDLTALLALVLMNQATLLSDVADLAATLVTYEEAIRLLRALIAQGHTDQEGELAAALANRANVLRERGRAQEALPDYDEVIGLLEKLVQQGRTGLQSRLALSFMNRGNTLKDLGRAEAAVASHGQAVNRYRQLVAQGRVELLDDLAKALSSLGGALALFGQPDQAIVNLDEAVTLRRRLMTNGRPEIEEELAETLINQGVALQFQGRYQEALNAYEEAQNCFQHLVKAGRADLEVALAITFLNSGGVLDLLDRPDEALRNCDEAISRCRQLVAGNQPQLSNRLAMALMNRGNILRRLKRGEEALACFGESIDLYLQVLEARGPEITGDLVMTLQSMGSLLKERGEANEALKYFRHAFVLCYQEFEAGRLYRIPQMMEVLRQCLEMRCRLQDWAGAGTDVATIYFSFMSARQAQLPQEPVMRELGNMLVLLRELSPDAIESLLAAIDSPAVADLVRTAIHMEVPEN